MSIAIDQNVEQTMAKLHERLPDCEECMSEICAFNPEGICYFPLLYGRKPEMDNDYGCHDCRISREAE